MEDIKVGEYVRTKNGFILKVLEYDKVLDMYLCTDNKYRAYLSKEDIVKRSKNIIDLIEVGDLVNNVYIYEVGKTEDGHKWVHSLNGLLLFTNDIKTILTKEQYNANCYKVKGE